MILSLLLAVASFQDTAALDASVAAFTGHGVGEEGGARAAIDTRLRLARCPTVSMSWRTEAHDAVVVACADPAWRIFVPAVRATPVATAAGGGAAVAVAKAAPVIRRGDPITIAADSDGFSITRDGIAMGDAAPGAHFLVKVDDAKAPVQAVAVAAGQATLPGWAN